MSGGSLHAGDPVPAPGKAILDVRGKVARVNAGDSLGFDMSEIDKLPQIDVLLYEPFLKKRVTYRGVFLKDLLAMAKPSATANAVHMIALDDFVTDFTMGEIASQNLVVATRENGELIPVAKGGPTRIVFPDDSSIGEDTEKWIWSLRTIEIR